MADHSMSPLYFYITLGIGVHDTGNLLLLLINELRRTLPH